MVRLKCWTKHLPNDRSVCVAITEELTDDSYYIFFTNKSVETKIRVSGEAMQEMVMLYAAALRDQQTKEAELSTPLGA